MTKKYYGIADEDMVIQTTWQEDLATATDRLRSRVVTFKVLLQRAQGYIAIVNSGMLIFIMLSSLKGFYGFDIELKTYLVPIYIATIGLFLLIAWVDNKSKMFHKEQEYISERNPTLMKILKEIREIKNPATTKLKYPVCKTCGKKHAYATINDKKVNKK